MRLKVNGNHLSNSIRRLIMKFKSKAGKSLGKKNNRNSQSLIKFSSIFLCARPGRAGAQEFIVFFTWSSETQNGILSLLLMMAFSEAAAPSSLSVTGCRVARSTQPFNLFNAIRSPEQLSYSLEATQAEFLVLQVTSRYGQS